MKPIIQKSATEMLIYRTYQETWKRGEQYANKGVVKLLDINDDFVRAEVKGTKLYQIKLAFRSGGLSRACDCPVGDFCKHMVAVAILWDEARGIPRPNQDKIESETIPPPLVSRAEINDMYNDPLHANLEVLRLAASESGSWSRPHSRLPAMPPFNTDKKEPLSIREIKKAFHEIERWSHRSTYDFYFCAGEMVAAFCEIMRIIINRLAVTSLLVAAEILRESQKFHYKLIMELIDDSDGLHIFTEAHLEDIYQYLKKMKIVEKEIPNFYKILQEFDEHRDDY